MMFPKYLVALLGILCQVDAKAFQNNIKGKFDHMYENLYWKNIAENTDANEMKYVPHVDGKPIFIPELSFSELDTIPIEGIVRALPNQWKNKYLGQHIQTTPPPSVVKKHGHSKLQTQFVHKSESELENKLYLNTYSGTTIPDIKHIETKPIKLVPSKTHLTPSKTKSNEVKHNPSSITVKTSYEPKKDSTKQVLLNESKKPLIHEDYDQPVVVDVIHNKLDKPNTLKDEEYSPPVVIRSTKKKFGNQQNKPHSSKVVKSSGHDSKEISKGKNKKPINQEAYKENDHPIVVDVITKEQTHSQDPEYSSKVFDMNKQLDIKLKENKQTEYAETYKNPTKDRIQEQSINHENYDKNIFIKNFNEEEITEDFNLPVVIRTFSVKHTKNGGEKNEIIKENIQNDPLKPQEKPGLYGDKSKIKVPGLKKIDYEKSFEHSPSKVITDPNVENPKVYFTKMKSTKVEQKPMKHKYTAENIDQKIINLPIVSDQSVAKSTQRTDDFSTVSNNLGLEIRERPVDFLSHTNPEYGEEEYDESEVDLNAETDYEEYDSPVVEDLMKKTADDQYDYDRPEIVEALVKKTAIDQYDYGDYDRPNVVEALVKKTTEIDQHDYGFQGDIAPVKKIPTKHAYKLPIKNMAKDKEYSTSIIDSSKLGEMNDKKGYDHSDVVNKSPLKNNKKLVKYSNKLKSTKSPIHSYYEDDSKFKEGLKSESTSNYKYPASFKEHDQDVLKVPDISVNPEKIVALTRQAVQPTLSSEESIPNNANKQWVLSHFGVDKAIENVGDETDRFDSGSGVINERSGILDNSISLLSKSNIWPLLSNFHSKERNKFKKCTTPSKEPGNCMPIQMCPVPNLQVTLDDLVKRFCVVDESFIGICCPEFPAETLKVTWENLENVSSSEPNTLETKHEDCGKIQEFGKDPQSWPWMAPLISVTTRRIFCGGVLIKEQYVLTAAHCTRKIPHNQILVVLGPMTSEKDPTNQEFAVVEIKRHAQYNPKTMQNDLALLKLSRRVPIGDTRRFICLPDEDTFVGEEALMLGWQGSFAASKNEEKLRVISAQECRKDVKVIVGDNIMCTEPRTEDVMCNVDSGAPLILKKEDRYQVIGLLTWNRNDCDSSFPSIFTRVSHFKRWIENHAV